MLITNIYEAKSKLSQLIEATLAGNEVVIAKAGKPLIQLTPFIPHKAKRKPGKFKGDIFMSKDFDKEDPRINKLFGAE